MQIFNQLGGIELSNAYKLIKAISKKTVDVIAKFKPDFIKGTMGKGYRGQAVKDALREHRGVYFGAIGGAGAVLSRHIKKLEIVAYEDLGTEAIRRLEVESFPAIVLNDCHGGDLYQDGQKQFAREG